MSAFWISTTGSELSQGDYLPGCVLPLVPDDFSPASPSATIPTQTMNVIVVTQSCDLANLKSGLVALCRVYTLKSFEAANQAYSKKGVWEEVRKGRREGLHLLASPTNPLENRDALVVNFREIFSLPIGYLRTHAIEIGQRWRLQSPFLEHFSQAFARFFMRVGLPSAIPPFKE